MAVDGRGLEHFVEISKVSASFNTRCELINKTLTIFFSGSFPLLLRGGKEKGTKFYKFGDVPKILLISSLLLR